MKLARRLLLSVPTFLVFFFTACSAHVGPTIEIYDIPLGGEGDEELSSIHAAVALEEIRDVRVPPINDEDGTARMTAPAGRVEGLVQAALREAFRARGITVSESAPLRIWGEIRKWKARIATTTTSSIKSEAALYLEVIDAAGSRVYSGTYHGSRASEFPIATASDIRASLSSAMAQAISQVLEDEEFLTNLHRR